MKESVLGNNTNNTNLTPQKLSNYELDEGIQQLWSLESKGITDSVVTTEDQIMVDRFNSSR